MAIEKRFWGGVPLDRKKKDFPEPEIEVVLLNYADVLLTSAEDDEDIDWDSTW